MRKMFAFRADPEQIARLRAQAAAMDMGVTEYARMVVNLATMFEYDKLARVELALDAAQSQEGQEVKEPV